MTTKNRRTPARSTGLTAKAAARLAPLRKLTAHPGVLMWAVGEFDKRKLPLSFLARAMRESQAGGEDLLAWYGTDPDVGTDDMLIAITEWNDSVVPMWPIESMLPIAQDAGVSPAVLSGQVSEFTKSGTQAWKRRNVAARKMIEQVDNASRSQLLFYALFMNAFSLQ